MSFTITFDINGGKVKDGQDSAPFELESVTTDGTDVNIYAINSISDMNIKFEKKYHKFIGWGLDRISITPIVDPVPNGSLDFVFGIWQPNTFTIEYYNADTNDLLLTKSSHPNFTPVQYQEYAIVVHQVDYDPENPESVLEYEVEFYGSDDPNFDTIQKYTPTDITQSENMYYYGLPKRKLVVDSLIAYGEYQKFLMDSLFYLYGINILKEENVMLPKHYTFYGKNTTWEKIFEVKNAIYYESAEKGITSLGPTNLDGYTVTLGGGNLITAESSGIFNGGQHGGVIFSTGGSGSGGTGGFINPTGYVTHYRYASYSGTRYIQTTVLDLRKYGNLSFQIIQGNSLNGGEGTDSNENFVIEYSNNEGSSFTTLNTMTGDPRNYVNWTLRNISLTSVHTNSIGNDVLRFRQTTYTLNSSTMYDNWGISGIALTKL
jgi:hypothetical protein